MNTVHPFWLAARRKIISVTAQIILIAAVPILYFNDPVLYIRFIAEDNWGEWATTVTLMLACLLFIISFLNTRDKKRRVWYIPFAVGAFLIAMEEIAWGQRVFLLATPEFFDAVNFQGEIGFHNVRAISPDELTYLVVSLGFVVYGLVLPALMVIFPKIGLIVQKIGLPVPHLRLSPLFVATAYYLGFSTLAKADEIGELFMGLSVGCFALDIALSNHSKPQITWLNAAATPIFLVSVLATGVFLTSAQLWVLQTVRKNPPVASPHFINRLNTFAASNLPARGQYQQAAHIFSYLEKNPHLAKDDWLINKAQLWRKMNQEVEAKVIFQNALNLEMKRYYRNPNDARVVTRVARIYSGLGNDDLSNKYWKEALAIHENELTKTTSLDRKARLHISRARTYLAMGEYNSSISEYVKASNLATTAESRNNIVEGIQKVLSLCRPEAVKTLGLSRGGQPIVQLMQWNEIQGMSQEIQRDEGKADWCGQAEDDSPKPRE